MNLARQTGADITSTDSALRQIRVKPVKGCLTTSQALSRLLQGSNYRATSVGANSYRIDRVARRREQPKISQAHVDTTSELPDIIVTGTKQRVALLHFPGSVHIIESGDFTAGTGRADSLDDLAQMSPIMQKTELGIGRNKLFIRGISDSSFNGPTQSTATIYFGDVQLGYSGSEPAPRLVDIERVEILEGPQETLYGAGAMSGIVRLAPHAVELDRISASATASTTFTDGGAPGFDSSAVLNIPLLPERAGLRFVGYRARDGGYIDDARRHADNINRTDTVGGRVALSVEPGDGWSFEGGLLAQYIDAADAGYAEAAAGPYNRVATLPEPYDSRLTLLRGVVKKQWDSGLEMVSATGVVRTRGSDSFDASRIFPTLGPIIYQDDRDGLLLSHETRFTRSIPGGVSWIVGGTLLYARDAQSRVIGSPANPVEIIGVTNTTRSASLYGETTIPLTSSFAVTAGARATIAQTQGDPSLKPREEAPQNGLRLLRAQPAFGLSWQLAPRFSAFARYQTGYRTGGIAVARGLGRVANFEPDNIKVGEVGLRRERSGARGIAFSTVLSVARWKDIQADLFSRFAQPYTSNIGDATIVAVEAVGDWRLAKGLKADAALLWTHNRTSGALAGTSLPQNRHLPDTPPFAGNLGLDYEWTIAGEHHFAVGAVARYVGRSVLGTGSFLDLSQGDFTTFSAAASWHWRNFETTLNLDNLTNDNSSRFAMGNPLTFGFREQTVPLRPRSVRIGVGVQL